MQTNEQDYIEKIKALEAQIADLKNKIKRSEERFLSVFQNSAMGYYRTDVNGDIIMANQALISMLGYRNLEDLQQINVDATYIKPTDQNRFKNLIQTQGRVSGFETEWKTKSGQALSVREYSWAVKDENGKILYYEGTVEDISAQKRYEAEIIAAKEEAVRAGELKTSFLANMSHEIRTPLNGILGFAQLLADELDEEQRAQYLEVINKSSHQLLRIISDVLDISKIEVGELSINKADFSLKTLLDDIYLTFYRKAEEQNISLIKEFNLDKDVIIYSDEFRVKQVFNNLIQNALKYTKQGAVSYGCNCYETHVECYVQDTGTGIPASMKDRIFDRFSQVNRADSVKFGGAGLGLSICKGIIDLLEGGIYLDENYTKGARFIFTLPA